MSDIFHHKVAHRVILNSYSKSHAKQGSKNELNYVEFLSIILRLEICCEKRIAPNVKKELLLRMAIKGKSKSDLMKDIELKKIFCSVAKKNGYYYDLVFVEKLKKIVP